MGAVLIQAKLQGHEIKLWSFLQILFQPIVESEGESQQGSRISTPHHTAMHIEAKFFKKFYVNLAPLQFYIPSLKGDKFLKVILFDLYKSTKFGTCVPDQKLEGSVKGQLILNCPFGIVNFFQKTNENKLHNAYY